MWRLCGKYNVKIQQLSTRKKGNTLNWQWLIKLLSLSLPFFKKILFDTINWQINKWAKLSRLKPHWRWPLSFGWTTVIVADYREDSGNGTFPASALLLIALLILARSTSPILTIWLVKRDAVTKGVANGILRVFSRDSSCRIGDGMGPMNDVVRDTGYLVVIFGLSKKNDHSWVMSPFHMLISNNVIPISATVGYVIDYAQDSPWINVTVSTRNSSVRWTSFNSVWLMLATSWINQYEHLSGCNPCYVVWIFYVFLSARIMCFLSNRYTLTLDLHTRMWESMTSQTAYSYDYQYRNRRYRRLFEHPW